MVTQYMIVSRDRRWRLKSRLQRLADWQPATTRILFVDTSCMLRQLHVSGVFLAGSRHRALPIARTPANPRHQQQFAMLPTGLSDAGTAGHPRPPRGGAGARPFARRHRQHQCCQHQRCSIRAHHGRSLGVHSHRRRVLHSVRPRISIWC